jgi:hypothetical protein
VEKAEKFAVALLVINDEEIFSVGYTSDIQRISQAGFVDRAWDIRLDNGHRPYPVVKKRVDYDIAEAPSDAAQNAFTGEISRLTGMSFAHNLHPIKQTYLFRETPKFWSDLFVAFSDNTGLPQGVTPEKYYAIYQGRIITNISSVKFVRL